MPTYFNLFSEKNNATRKIRKKDNTFSFIKIISLPAVKAASGLTCLMFSYQNLSPNLYRLNWFAKRHEKVGPRIPPSTGFSVSPPAYRSISCGLLFEKSENYYKSLNQTRNLINKSDCILYLYLYTLASLAAF